MNVVLAVALGGGIGAVMRHYAAAIVTAVFGSAFPYGILFVNILGSFLIGLIMELSALKLDMPLEARAFLVTGFLGGFTTFSAFSLDVFRLIEGGQYIQSLLYILASVIVSISALFLAVYVLRAVIN